MGSQQYPHVLAGYGRSVAEKLLAAIDTFEVIRLAKVRHQPTFGLDGIKPDNVDERLATFATELSTSLPLSVKVGAVPVSVSTEAKTRALNLAAQAVIAEAGAAVPHVIESLEPSFRHAVTTLTDAVAALPEELTADTLVSSGVEVLDSYHRALSAAAEIEAVDMYLALLNKLPDHAEFSAKPVLRVLVPASLSDYFALAQAPDQLRLRGAFVAAARLGTEWKMQTPRESAALWQELDRRPVESKGQPLLSVR
jgi:hypothetical protein